MEDMARQKSRMDEKIHPNVGWKKLILKLMNLNLNLKKLKEK